MPMYLIKQRDDDNDIAVVSETVGYVEGSPQDADAVVNALNELGPLSILVDASSWSSYESGIFSGCVGKRIDGGLTWRI